MTFMNRESQLIIFTSKMIMIVRKEQLQLHQIKKLVLIQAQKVTKWLVLPFSILIEKLNSTIALISMIVDIKISWNRCLRNIISISKMAIIVKKKQKKFYVTKRLVLILVQKLIKWLVLLVPIMMRKLNPILALIPMLIVKQILIAIQVKLLRINKT